MLEDLSANEFDWAERIGRLEALTAARKPLSSEFLSAKAKAQPRDAHGQWIEMGALVRWPWDKTPSLPRDKKMGRPPKYARGHVTKFDPATQKYSVTPVGGSSDVSLDGQDLEVIKAVAPSTKAEARLLTTDAEPVLPATPPVAPPVPSRSADLTSKRRTAVRVGDVMRLGDARNQGEASRRGVVTEHDPAAGVTTLRDVDSGQEHVFHWNDITAKQFYKNPELHGGSAPPPATSPKAPSSTLPPDVRSIKKEYLRVGDVMRLGDARKGEPFRDGVVISHDPEKGITRVADVTTGKLETVDWGTSGSKIIYRDPAAHGGSDLKPRTGGRAPDPNKGPREHVYNPRRHQTYLGEGASKKRQKVSKHVKPGDVIAVGGGKGALVLSHDPDAGVTQVRSLDTGEESTLNWGDVKTKVFYAQPEEYLKTLDLP